MSNRTRSAGVEWTGAASGWVLNHRRLRIISWAATPQSAPRNRCNSLTLLSRRHFGYMQHDGAGGNLRNQSSGAQFLQADSFPPFTACALIYVALVTAPEVEVRCGSQSNYNSSLKSAIGRNTSARCK
ncbi:hypothetical protein EK21DRAFT_83973 [Setomelanomma holmii]|uniref:Uncharacterized protein n=1 Tax=Setomelanomma holmii TaxID=210430 RepID=A0A9P4LSC7_9PLEO|nr:hypothetical protein EK21DRAFT_83973 [Setomelanomma holmii]